MSKEKTKAQVFAARLFSTLLLWLVVTGIFMSDSPWAFVGLITLLGVAASREYFQMAKNANYPCQYCWGMLVSVLYLGGVGYLLASDGQMALLKISIIDGVKKNASKNRKLISTGIIVGTKEWDKKRKE